MMIGKANVIEIGSSVSNPSSSSSPEKYISQEDSVPSSAEAFKNKSITPVKLSKKFNFSNLLSWSMLRFIEIMHIWLFWILKTGNGFLMSKIFAKKTIEVISSDEKPKEYRKKVDVQEDKPETNSINNALFE